MEEQHLATFQLLNLTFRQRLGRCGQETVFLSIPRPYVCPQLCRYVFVNQRASEVRLSKNVVPSAKTDISRCRITTVSQSHQYGLGLAGDKRRHHSPVGVKFWSAFRLREMGD